jgi:2,2-dialkylglycine decarboxylase (pyruvate)
MDSTPEGREQPLLDLAREYAFRNRLDKGGVAGPVLEWGRGSIVRDVTGKEYLDYNSGQMCAALGHSHPRIVAAIKESADTLIHASSSYYNVKEIQLAARLGQLVPRPLQKSMFLGSGSDSNEGAITIAKKYTGGFEVASPHVSFHGMSEASRSVTYAGWHTGYGPGMPGTTPILAPYCYRCPVNQTFPSCELACLKGSLELLDAQTTGSRAAIITEPLFSAGGVIEPPPGWLAALKRAAHDRGMLLILDEAQTGLGKLGRMFACEEEGVIPDIMTLSKHLGGGIEISAIVTTPEIEAVAAGRGLVIGHSHTNDPLACNAALASLEIIVEDDLPARAAEVGKYWRGHLDHLAGTYEAIGDVRGRGLIQGIEFVRDRHRKEPYRELGRAVTRHCLGRGLLFSARRDGSVLRFVPPFHTTRAELDRAGEILGAGIGAALDEVARAR